MCELHATTGRLLHWLFVSSLQCTLCSPYYTCTQIMQIYVNTLCYILTVAVHQSSLDYPTGYQPSLDHSTQLHTYLPKQSNLPLTIKDLSTADDVTNVSNLMVDACIQHTYVYTYIHIYIDYTYLATYTICYEVSPVTNTCITSLVTHSFCFCKL